MTVSLFIASLVVARAAPEVCNGADDDADGQVDETPLTWFADEDGDGAGDPSVPIVTPSCANPGDASADALDCDDDDGSVGPGGAEVLNAVDDDCDGLVDEDNLPLAVTVDWDLDSTFLFVDQLRFWPDARTECEDLGYHLLVLNDAAENAAVVSGLAPAEFWWMGWQDPGSNGNFQWIDGTAVWGLNWGPQQPNGSNHDCGFIQEISGEWFDWNCLSPAAYVCEADCEPQRTYADDDGDGYGDRATEAESCDVPAGRVLNAADCDDAVAAVTVHLWFEDTDGDGFGDPSVFVDDCGSPGGFVEDGTDCDITDGDLNPATEWLADTDQDGYGGAVVATGCIGPGSATLIGGDCDDDEPLVNPDGLEICGGGDEDCDGAVDDADPSVDPATTSDWYFDDDGDGYGVGEPLRACAAPDDHAPLDGDCDDADPLESPGAYEQCDEADNDCDGIVDEDVVDREWYVDADHDGFGDPDQAVVDCLAPEGSVPDGTDCDDTDDTVFPGALEVDGDGVDQDCDGVGGVVHPDRTVDAPSEPSPDPGCGCATSSPSPWWAGLLLVLRRRQSKNTGLDHARPPSTWTTRT